jgi:hypothetical protein
MGLVFIRFGRMDWYRAGGTSPDDVIRPGVFFTDIAPINEVYKE